MKSCLLGIAAMLGLTLPAFGQSGKAPDGIYQLNYEKSSIHGPIAQSQTVNIGPGDTNTIIGIGVDGKPYTMIDTGIVDGKPHPVTGSPIYDTTTWTQVGPYTISLSRSKAGKVVQTGYTIFNPKTNTITLTIAGTDGAYSHVLIYEKIN
jgi:hypothetical protein